MSSVTEKIHDLVKEFTWYYEHLNDLDSMYRVIKEESESYSIYNDLYGRNNRYQYPQHYNTEYNEQLEINIRAKNPNYDSDNDDISWASDSTMNNLNFWSAQKGDDPAYQVVEIIANSLCHVPKSFPDDYWENHEKYDEFEIETFREKLPLHDSVDPVNDPCGLLEYFSTDYGEKGTHRYQILYTDENVAVLEKNIKIIRTIYNQERQHDLVMHEIFLKIKKVE